MTKRSLILIAEDDHDDFLILSTAFEEIKVPVDIHRVDNGFQVLQCLKEIADTAFFPDLILLDMNMPVLCGTDTLSRLKENDRYKNIPVVIHTTIVIEDEKEKCLQLGAAAFLQKPADFGKVLSHARFFMSLVKQKKGVFHVWD